MDRKNFENQVFDTLPEKVTCSNFRKCTFNASTLFDRCNLIECVFNAECQFDKSNVIEREDEEEITPLPVA